MASRYHGQFEVSGKWVREMGLVAPDFANCWVIVGFNRELMAHYRGNDVSLGVCVYVDAPTLMDVMNDLRYLIRDDYANGCSFDYEIWHMVFCPDYLGDMGCAYCKNDFVRHGDEFKEFATMDDAMDYVRTALGEWSVEFDVWRIAQMITTWYNGRLVLRDVDFWAIVAANDLSLL